MKKIRMAVLSVIFAAALSACGKEPPAPPVAAPAPEAQSDLKATLNYSDTTEGIAFVFRVKNDTPEKVKLEFSSTQRFNFMVFNDKNETVYNYASDKMFTQQLSTEVLAGGAELIYSETLPIKPSKGKYRAEFAMTDKTRKAKQNVSFNVLK